MTNAISRDGAWQDVRDLIGARRTGELADRVLALTGPERAEVARRLPEFRAQARAIAVRAERVSWGGEEDDEDGRDWDALVSADDGTSGLGEALRIAAVTAGSPASAPASATGSPAPRERPGSPRVAR
ncbi:hypothetical protein [Nonomuraea glycinis]|uniref:hypothetical protein n=1 Tax=Nonomuraea glycinis TaxID=2047744 RepID=UPI0033ABFC9D